MPRYMKPKWTGGRRNGAFEETFMSLLVSSFFELLANL